MKRLKSLMAVVMVMLVIVGMTGCSLIPTGGVTPTFPTTIPTTVYTEQVRPLIEAFMIYQGNNLDPKLKLALDTAISNLDLQAALGSDNVVDIPTALVPVVVSAIEMNSGAINLKPQDAALALVALELVHSGFATNSNAFESALYPILKSVLTNIANQQPKVFQAKLIVK
jgi:hypothetical protein